MYKQQQQKVMAMTSTSRRDVEVMAITFCCCCLYIKRGTLKVDHHGQHVVRLQFEDSNQITNWIAEMTRRVDQLFFNLLLGNLIKFIFFYFAH